MRTYLVTALLILCNGLQAYHIVGGYISYRWISGTTYEIKLTVYRDCNSTTQFDEPALVGVFEESTGALYTQLSFSNPTITSIQPPNDNPCLQNTSGVCVEEGVYTATISLPSSTEGYTISYERCCRNSTVTNVSLPDEQGAAYSAYIPPTTPYQNSSPVFNTVPPLFICVNSPLVFNYSASDIDGDVLHYSLCTPSSAGSNTAPIPNPPWGPPYPAIPWQPPYGLNNLLGGIPLQVDYNTGVLTGTPNTVGQFVVGVCVSEYRGGQLIATYLRDFQFNVAQCNIPISNIPSTDINPTTGIGLYIQNCKNLTVVFQNNSYNPPPASVPLTYFWDFGVPGIDNDTSIQQYPTFIYPDTGVYLVKLIAVKSSGTQPCSDTTYAYVKIYPTFISDFTTADVCANVDATFTGQTTTTYGTIDSWEWDFGDGSTDNIQNTTHAYTAPGTYTVTLINEGSLGCRDTMQKSITIFDAPDATISYGPICINSPVTFTSVPGNITSYSWSLGNGATSTASSATTTYTSASNFTVTLSMVSADGCPDSSSQVITVHPLPVINITDDTVVCSLTSVQLSASGGVTYAWSPPTGLDFTNIANPVATPSGGAITYVVTVTDQFQCVNVDSVNVSFYTLLPVEAGPDTSVCLNPGSFRDSVQLNASGVSNYLWTPINGLTANNISNPVARPSVNTVYTVHGTDANGCPSVDSLTVYVLDPALNIIIDDSKTVCLGDTVYVNTFNQGVSQYSWNPSQYLTDPNNLNTGFFPPDTTNYVLTISNYCYTKTDQVLIMVRPLPVLSLNDVDSVCYGEFIQLSVGNAQTFLWDADSSLSAFNIPNPVASPLTTTYYYVTGTDVMGCSNRDSTLIVVMPLPAVNAGPDTMIWRDTYATLHGTTTESNFTWFPQTDLESPFSLVTIAEPTKSTWYVLSVEDEHGCNNFDSVLITVVVNTQLYVPTAFSPNGDGINDVFRIVRWLNIAKLKEFAIYNRWGERVFVTDNLHDGWNGIFKSKEQPLGTFAWIVVALTKDGEEIVHKGNVTLVR